MTDQLEQHRRQVAELRREGPGTCLNCGEAIVRHTTTGGVGVWRFHEADDGPWALHRHAGGYRMQRDALLVEPPTAMPRYRYHRCDHEEALADVR